MIFRETLETILKGTSYEFRMGEPHIHLSDVLAVVQAEKEGKISYNYQNINNIPSQFGLDENGLTPSCSLYQNVAHILHKASPESIRRVDEDGFIWIDIDVEIEPQNNLHKLTPAGKEVLCGLLYLTGIGQLILSVENYIDENMIDNGVNQLIKALSLLPDEKSIIEAVEQGQEIKRAAQLEIKPPKKSGCFIATAVYGDIMAPEVVCLRQYRDTILNSTKTGRGLIELYYWTSPPIAVIVGKSTLLKAIFRNLLLSPLVLFIERSRKRPESNDSSTE